MTYQVHLPALDGREPLGFLAALGALRLLAEEAHANVRLSFSDDTATAVISGPYADVDAVAAELTRIATDQSGVVPGASEDFPRKAGRGADPNRVTRPEFRKFYAELGRQEEARWLTVLLTDLAVDGQDRVALTPYSAPSGKMNLRTFLEKPVSAVRAEPRRIHEALVGWRRVDGVTGEYLDHRVLRSSADHPLGESLEAGVPGATWLAIMALPLLRLTGDGRNVAATLWHRVGVARRPIMVWPLWTRPLDLAAVQVLLEHPAMRPRSVDNGSPAVQNDGALDALGVFAVCGAERQPVRGRKFPGVLAPLPVLVTRRSR